MRNKKLEFQPPAGNAPVTRISHIDWYAGPWDSIEHANQMVLDSLKEVGRRFDIYKDSNKKEILPYYWGKNNVGNFIAISMDNQTGTKVVSIGDIIVSDDSVIVELGPDNTISVMFDWITYSLDDSVQLSITPVSQDKIKVIVVYALPTEQLIYVVEGQEGTETVEPDIPEGALFIRRGIATSEGIDFDPEVDLIEYKKKIEDNWLVVPFTSPTDSLPFTIEMIDERTNFYMTGGDGTGEAILKGIKILGANRDLDFKIYNASSKQITINSSVSFKATKGFSTFTTPLIIKPYTVAELKYSSNDNIIHIMKKAEAGDGKNVTNSSNTTTGSWEQTQRVGDTFTWDTQGQPYSIKNLPDKSNDASFTHFLGKNNQGQFSKVGYPALNNLFSSFTQEQALQLAQLLNGGVGSAGQISVNTIAPPLFELEDNNVYIVLRGTNLNLNVLNSSIHIVRASDNTVMATVPNSQIQLYADGLSLVFYYNFNALPEDMYKLKITSGVKVLITALSFQIVGSVENIDTSAIVWNKLIDTNVITNDQSTGNGGNISISDNQNAVNTTSPVISMLSSQLFAQGEDWYIELQVSTGNKRPQYKTLMTRIGVCSSNISNQLVFLPIHFWEYGKQETIVLITHINTVQGNIQFEGEGDKVTSKILSITKIGNILTITDGKQVGIMTISNNSGYALSVQASASISVYPNISPYNNEVCTVTILKAFKIL